MCSEREVESVCSALEQRGDNAPLNMWMVDETHVSRRKRGKNVSNETNTEERENLLGKLLRSSGTYAQTTFYSFVSNPEV